MATKTRWKSFRVETLIIYIKVIGANDSKVNNYLSAHYSDES